MTSHHIEIATQPGLEPPVGVVVAIEVDNRLAEAGEVVELSVLHRLADPILGHLLDGATGEPCPANEAPVVHCGPRIPNASIRSSGSLPAQSDQTKSVESTAVEHADGEHRLLAVARRGPGRGDETAAAVVGEPDAGLVEL